MADRPRTRGNRGRALTAIGIAGFLVVASGAVAYAATRPGGPTYRTATATSTNVAQTLRAIGTIEPASSATVSFPVSGTVARVLVATGDRVSAGQQLASLDTTSLEAKVVSAKADVASAELTLQQDTTRQASGGASSGTTGSATTSARTSTSAGATGTTSRGARTSTSAGTQGTTPPSTTSRTAAGSGGGTSRAVTTAAEQVQRGQHQVDQAIAGAKADLARAISRPRRLQLQPRPSLRPRPPLRPLRAAERTRPPARPP